jgi:Ca2+/Na+ antiporter
MFEFIIFCVALTTLIIASETFTNNAEKLGKMMRMCISYLFRN